MSGPCAARIGQARVVPRELAPVPEIGIGSFRISGARIELFKPVSTKLDVPALEREVIARWAERDTMARYLSRNDASERKFSFIDGPITANNPMGVHHAWGRTYKDLFQRYHTML